MRLVPTMVMLLSLAVLAAACAGGAGSRGEGAASAAGPEPVAETCAVRLPPREAGASSGRPALAPLAVPRSTLVVNVEVPLAGVRQSLDARVPRRVAEERDHDLGKAGHLEYTVDRGPFATRFEGGALVVEAMLQGRAQACARGRCYAGCAPRARATARVPLRVGADYKLRTSEVRIDVTQGCEVRVLGGLLSLDVTPILRSVLAAQSRSVQASIDRELPDLRTQAERLWRELSTPKALPLGACVVLVPEDLTQGVASGNAELAALRFGLIARPEVRMGCAGGGAGTATGERPLPPLREDRLLGEVGDVHLAVVVPEAAVRRALERGPIAMGPGRARVSEVAGDASSGLEVGLAGEICGPVGMGASGAAFHDPRSLQLTGVAPLAGEAARLESAGVEAAGLVRWLEGAPIPLPVSVEALGALLPELASSLSDEHVKVGASVTSATPELAGLRGGDLVAVALLRGAVTLKVAAK